LRSSSCAVVALPVPDVFLVGLILGGGHGQSCRMYAGALTTFLILFGSGISPLPPTTPESFSTRIGYVLWRSGTLSMMALLWPRERYAATRPSLRSPGRAATRRRARRRLRFLASAARCGDRQVCRRYCGASHYRADALPRCPRPAVVSASGQCLKRGSAGKSALGASALAARFRPSPTVINRRPVHRLKNALESQSAVCAGA